MSNQTDGSEPAFPADWVDFQPTTGEQVVREQFFGFTQRQYTAIRLRVPQSGLPWLDEMIEQARRDAFAGQALQGLMAGSKTMETPERFALGASVVADAMIEAGRGK